MPKDDMMTRGRGGVSIPPKSDDVIYEQPLRRVQCNQTSLGKFGLAVRPRGAQTEGLCSPRPDCRTQYPVGSFCCTGRVLFSSLNFPRAV